MSEIIIAGKSYPIRLSYRVMKKNRSYFEGGGSANLETFGKLMLDMVNEGASFFHTDTEVTEQMIDDMDVREILQAQKVVTAMIEQELPVAANGVEKKIV